MGLDCQILAGLVCSAVGQAFFVVGAFIGRYGFDSQSLRCYCGSHISLFYQK